MGGRRWHSVTLGVVAVGLAGAVGASAAGVRLAGCFVPRAPWGDVASPSGSARWSEDLSAWQGWSMAVLLVSTVVTLTLTFIARDGIRRPATAIGAAVAAVVLGSLAAVTKPMVQFDQIALWPVTVGEEIEGYWFAAFDDDVRFVLVGNAEVSQQQYGSALVTHLLAPVLAGVALLVVGRLVWQAQSGATSSSVAP